MGNKASCEQRQCGGMRVEKECDNLTVLHHGTVVGVATLEEDGELVDPERLDVVA